MTVDVPEVLDAAEPWAVSRAVALLRAGAVVAVPTDTVYGLAVDPVRAGAVERIFALKGRPADLPLPVLVGGRGQVAVVAGRLEAAARGLADRYWPGPLTLVVPRHPDFTPDLGGRSGSRRTVGVRWPDHPLVRSLCLEVGPLAVTSANRHGEPPATSAAAVVASFPFGATPGGDLAAVLDAGRCDGVPSTVVECLGPATRCLRDGALPWAELSHGGRSPDAPAPRG